MTRAVRRLVLEMEHERGIHTLCHAADCAVHVLRDKGQNEMADRLESAWKLVSQEIMP